MTTATRSNWGDVWDAFDRRKQAKNAVAANEDAGEGDMFSKAGGAAE